MGNEIGREGLRSSAARVDMAAKTEVRYII